jgi:hypothetical protein
MFLNNSKNNLDPLPNKLWIRCIPLVLHLNITMSHRYCTIYMLLNILQIPTWEIPSVVPIIQLHDQMKIFTADFQKTYARAFLYTALMGIFMMSELFHFSHDRGTICWKIFAPVPLVWLSRFLH